LIIILLIFITLLAIFLSTYFRKVPLEFVKSNKGTEIQQPAELITIGNGSVIQQPKKSTSTNLSIENFDRFGIRILNQTIPKGRVWFSNWSNGKSRTIKSGKTDPFNEEFVARGNGEVFIDGKGIAHLKGVSPRMYVYDKEQKKKWNNVEVTVYAKRISESKTVSSQGIVIGARSEHQNATLQNPCLGASYYGRLLYDGRSVFQKEVIHEGAYSSNKPEENLKTTWNTSDRTMPKNIWIGLKFIVKTNPDGKSVKLELYRDMTNGINGGSWEKLAEYTDSGDWSQINKNVDVMKICGYSAGKILLNPGTSVFIRNDYVTDVEYKNFSIREIQ
jgi:hypothetical protein